MERPTLQESISWQRTLLYYTGYYPIRKNVLFYLSRIIVQVWSWAMLFSLLIRMAVDMPNIVKVLETLHFSTTQIAFICKSTQFLMRIKDVKAMEKELYNPLFNGHTVSQDRFIIEARDNTRYFGKMFWSFLFCCVSSYIAYPFLDNKLIAVPAWIPFDIEKHRVPVMVFQSFGFIFNAYNNSCIDLVMSGMISLMSAQLEILMDTLKNLTKKENGEDESEEIIYDKIKKCVQQHDAILSFVDRIESAFSIGVLCQFFASIITICLTGIMFLSVSLKSLQFVALFTYLICMVNQIALSCWFGHDIMFKSEQLVGACYMNNWYETSKRVKHGLFMMMERAKRPVYLTAGTVFILNLTTYVMILRSSYSYFAVLQRLYKD